jgi:N-acetylmuramoyl-L-alanine amidase
MVKKVSYGAGHGMYTSGKRTPDDEREWSFNNKVALAFAAEMSNYEGVALRRHDDPTGKRDVPLDERTDDSNAWGADVYVSLHHNAMMGYWSDDWTGVQVHVYETRPAGSTALAKRVLPEIVKAYGLHNRGIIYNNLHITRETNCDAILVEGGFMDSTIDIHKLRDDKVLRNAGVGIAKAVAAHLGLKRKSGSSKPAATVSGDSYKVKSGDTLWGISRKTGVSVANLRKFNGLSSDLITVGQVLTLVPKSVSKPKSTGIKTVGEIKITNLNNFTYIYADTNDSSTRLGKAYKGKVFPIAGSVPNWWEIVYKGRRAYVKEKYGSRV